MNRTASFSDTRSIRTTGYLRPTWQEAVAEYLPRSWRGERCVRWIDRLPLAAVLAVYVAMCARLDNTAFIDEARAISAGRSVLLRERQATSVSPRRVFASSTRLPRQRWTRSAACTSHGCSAA